MVTIELSSPAHKRLRAPGPAPRASQSLPHVVKAVPSLGAPAAAGRAWLLYTPHSAEGGQATREARASLPRSTLRGKLVCACMTSTATGQPTRAARAVVHERQRLNGACCRQHAQAGSVHVCHVLQVVSTGSRADGWVDEPATMQGRVAVCVDRRRQMWRQRAPQTLRGGRRRRQTGGRAFEQVYVHYRYCRGGP
jgi:hypothetical protein